MAISAIKKPAYRIKRSDLPFLTARGTVDVGRKIAVSARQYYRSVRGVWLHNASIQKRDAPALIRWLSAHKPDHDTHSIEYFVDAMSFGKSWIRADLNHLKFWAGSYAYLNSAEGRWLLGSSGVNFNDFFQVVGWLRSNKPNNDDHSLGYILQAMSFVNPSIAGKLKNYQFWVGAYEYYHGDKGKWLKRFSRLSAADTKIFFDRLHANLPADISLNYAIQALCFGNNKVREAHKELLFMASAYEYSRSAQGKWLKKASEKRFTGPLDAINWLNVNRPSQERGSLSLFMEALSFLNPLIRSRYSLFTRAVTSYRYYHSNNGAWLRKAARIKFRDPYQLVDWLVANKPSANDATLSYYVQCLKFGNRSVDSESGTFIRVAGAHSYIQKNKAAWEELCMARKEILEGGEKEHFRSYKRHMDLSVFTYLNDPARQISNPYLWFIVQVFIRASLKRKEKD